MEPEMPVGSVIALDFIFVLLSMYSLAATAVLGILDSSCGKHVCYTGSVPCVDAYFRPGCLQHDIIHTPYIMDDELESTAHQSSVEMFNLTLLQMVKCSRCVQCWMPLKLFYSVLSPMGLICKEQSMTGRSDSLLLLLFLVSQGLKKIHLVMVVKSICQTIFCDFTYSQNYCQSSRYRK